VLLGLLGLGSQLRLESLDARLEQRHVLGATSAAAWWCSTELLQLGGQLLLLGTQTVRLGLGSTELALCGSKLRLRVLCLATSVAVID
jgi:hypothetical protein